MAVATKEMVMERTTEAPKTFKVASGPTGPDYHYLHIIVGPAALPDGTKTGDMFDAEVVKWLRDGYELFACYYEGEYRGDDRVLRGYMYGFHFLKK